MKVSKVWLAVSVVSFVITSFVHAAPIAEGMVAYWSFEGNVTDLSGRGHDGAVTGATYSSNSGEYAFLGQSIHFDGSGDYVSVADHDDLDFTTKFTMMMWIKPTDVSNYVFLIDKWVDRGGDLRAYSFYQSSTNIGLYVNSTGSTSGYPSAIGLQQNKWQHITLSFDADNQIMKYYLNGTVVDEHYVNSGTIYNSPYHLLIGAYNNRNGGVGGYYYEGYMDEVILYNTALSDAQVLSNYESGPGIPDPVLPDIVPEPISIVLLGMGIAGWIVRKR